MNRKLTRAANFNRNQQFRKLRTAGNPIVEQIEQRMLLSAALSNTALNTGGALNAQTTHVFTADRVTRDIASDSTISGTVFDDANEDRVQDDGETGLVGWKVYIDLSNTGIFNSADPSTTTNASGHYSLAGLTAGSWIVRVLPPSGWNQTTPVDNYGQHVTVAMDGTATGVNFGFYHAPIVVNTTADSVDPITSTTVSLRDAVNEANAALGPVAITFSPALFATAGLKTIALSKGTINFADTAGTTTVTGPGATKLAISGENASRVFATAANTSVVLAGLTVTGGSAPVGSGTNSDGGGIYNAGTLVLNTVTVSDCSATGVAATVFTSENEGEGRGGGIYSTGALTLQNSTITGNSAAGASNEKDATFGAAASGGGVFSTGTLIVTGSTISDNTATGGADGNDDHQTSTGGSATGGGIFSSGPLTLTDSTVSRNVATAGATTNDSDSNSYGGSATGGGIFSGGSLTITESTVSSNTAAGGAAETVDADVSSYGGSATGGGIASGPLTITNSTIEGNAATAGDATAEDVPNGGSASGGGISCGSLTITGSTISSNSATGGTAPIGSLANGLALSNGGSAEGGGISGAALTVTNCTFGGDNATGGSAGETYLDGYAGGASGGAIYASALTVTNSTFSGNSAIGGTVGGDDFGESGGTAQGGALYCTGSTTLGSTNILNNEAVGGNSESWGVGGNALGGGVYSGGALIVSSSFVSGNAANAGFSTSTPPGLENGLSQAQGGGLFCASTLSLTLTTVSDNTATGGGGTEGATFPASEGGGIFVAGAADITQSRVTGNGVTGGSASNGGASAEGGGIYAENSTIISLSTVAGNTAVGGNATPDADDETGPGTGGNAYGGGIYLLQSTVHVLQSNVSNNVAQGGNSGDTESISGITAETGGFATAGIYDAIGTIRLIDSTMAGNTATGGTGGPAVVSAGVAYPGGRGGDGTGAMLAPDLVQIYDSTISGNSGTGGAGGAASSSGGKTAPAGQLGGAVGGISNYTNQVLLDNTIVSANKANGVFRDLAGTISTASANNLLGTGSGLTNGVNGNQVGVTNPLLSVLGNYGGPTQSMYPLPGSPALGAGSTALIPSGYTTDQRGLPRVVNGKVDIGAVEFSQIVITGSVYNDLNGDGVRQTNEPGLAGWQVYIDLNDSGVYVVGDPVATTNSLGNYTLTFSPITVTGNLIVRENRLSAWRRTEPAGIYPLGDYSINPAAGTAANIDFGDSLTNLVTGTVFDDLNGNGKQDSGEPGLGGWVVEVDSYVNGKWDDDVTSATTNSSGAYQLVLAAGTYRLHDVLKSGLKPTVPSSGDITLVLTTGLTDTGENFGNR